MSNTTQTNAGQSATPGATAITPIKGFLILAGIVVAIGVFLVLNHLLGITEVWVAFLFLLYWAGIDHANMQTLPNCIVGAALGLLLAYALQQLPLSMGNAAGFSVFLGVILAVVYCQIMGWLLLAVNMATMLFLTVGTVPLIQASFNFSGALSALAAGATYFAGLVWVGQWLQRRQTVAAKVQ